MRDELPRGDKFFVSLASLVAVCVFCVAGFFLPGVAWGAVSIRQDTQITLLRGTTTVNQFASWEACEAEALRLANADTRTTGTVTYSCQTERRRIVATYSPNCPARPADETRPQACPPGQVGTWTQTRTYSSTAYPTCWITGEWLPASAPTGACTVPDQDGDGVPDATDQCPAQAASTPNGCPVFPAPEGFAVAIEPCPTAVTCVNRLSWQAVPGAVSYSVERQRPADSAPTQIACVNTLSYAHSNLAADTLFRYRVRASRSASCAGEFSPYTPTLEARSGTVASTPGQAVITWTPPTQAGLVRYTLLYGTRPDALVNAEVVEVTATSVTVMDLSPGAWYFAMTAHYDGQVVSGLSNIATKVVQ